MVTGIKIKADINRGRVVPIDCDEPIPDCTKGA